MTATTKAVIQAKAATNKRHSSNTNLPPAQEPPAAPARRSAPVQPTAPVDDIDDDIPF